MKKIDFSSFANIDRFSQRLEELRAGLEGIDPATLAYTTGAVWEQTSREAGHFKLSLWNRPLAVYLPGWIIRRLPTGEETSPIDQALILYYFSLADGAPLSRRWISFSDLPDGRFYIQAFHGYTGQKLAQVFQNDQAGFVNAAVSLGGSPSTLGDASFEFWALPRAPILVVYWRGDEDFPSSAQVLFDASASHYLTTDAYAILGSTLTRRLIAASQSPH